MKFRCRVDVVSGESSVAWKYPLLFTALFLAVDTVSGGSSTAWKHHHASRHLIDIDYILSLSADRHSEIFDEHNAVNPQLLPDHSMLPSFPPTTLAVPSAPTSPVSAPSSPIVEPTSNRCTATKNGSYGVTTPLVKSSQVLYKYEVRYEKMLNGASVNDGDVSNAVEIGLSNSIVSSLFPACGTNADRRLSPTIVGITAKPDDTIANTCVSEEGVECRAVEGALTLFSLDTNDIESILSDASIAIQALIDSGILALAHPSILSLLYVKDDRTQRGDPPVIDDTISPDDDDTSSSSSTVIMASIAGAITLLAAGALYVTKSIKKGSNSDQNSQNDSSMNYEEDAIHHNIT